MSRKIVAGVIAEDASDVDVAFSLISRIAKKSNYTKMQFVGGGCGRVKNKLAAWCENLSERGCNKLIIIHDLDRNDKVALRKALSENLQTAEKKIADSVIVIPIEEIEAWMLSDMSALKSVFNLKKQPRDIHHPEAIKSPKEFLERLIYHESGKERRYLNTKHNLSIANRLDMVLLEKRCGSFKPLREFVAKTFA